MCRTLCPSLLCHVQNSLVLKVRCQLSGAVLVMKTYENAHTNNVLHKGRYMREVQIHGRLRHKRFIRLWAAFLQVMHVPGSCTCLLTELCVLGCMCQYTVRAMCA